MRGSFVCFCLEICGGGDCLGFVGFCLVFGLVFF